MQDHLPRVELIWLDENSWQPGPSLVMEPSPRWVLWRVEHGSIQLTWDAQSVTVSAGQFCLMAPCARRCLLATGPVEWLSLGLAPHPGLVPEQAVGLKVWTPTPAEAHVYDALLPLLREWRQAPSAQTTPALEAALVFLLEWAGWRGQTSLDTSRPPWLRKAVRMLEEAPRRDLAEVARAVGYSPAQFRARFQHFTGYSPRDFAALCLDRQARHLLTVGEQGIDQISRRLGFTAPGHFTRFFKRHNGLTPQAFRSGRSNS